MPKVPEYQRTETLRPAFRQNVDVNASPEAFGAGIGRAMQQGGQALGQVADAVARINAFDDENKAKDADNKFADWARERMYGQGGYLTTEGRNAVEGRGDLEKEIEAKRREFGADLTGGAAKMFERASTARYQSIAQQAIQHQATQRKSWFSETSTARVNGFANDAFANAGDPALVQKNIAAGLLELDSRGQMLGWPPEMMAQEKTKFTSGVHSGVVQQIAEADPLAADKYINDHSDAFLPGDKLKLQKLIEAPVLAAKTDRWLGGALVGAPPLDFNTGGPAATAYDVVLGMTPGKAVGRFGTPPKPITTMSISEVLSFGKNTLIPNSKAAGVGRDERGLIGSSAVGAYQITSETLQRYAPKVLGPDWQSQPFTADVQDKIGEAIFNDAKKLGAGMSGIWASLSPARAEQVSKMPWSQAKNVIAASEGTGKLTPSAPAGDGGAGWYASMLKQADAIKDPQEREAAYAAIDRYFNREKRKVEMTKDQVASDLEKRMISDPSFDPQKLPLATQQILGVSGMAHLQAAHDAKLAEGKIKTDVVVLDELQSKADIDPDGFAKMDLMPYMSKLSQEDFLRLRGKQRSALADTAKVLRDGSVYKDALSVAATFYDHAGIITGNSENAKSETNKKAKADFNGAMRTEVDQFIEKNKRKPTYDEMRAIASALTIPLIGAQARGEYSPMRLFGSTEAVEWNGRAYRRGSVPTGLTVKRGDVKISDVPPEWIEPIKQTLQKQKKPITNENIAAEWYNQALSIIGSN